MAAAISLKEVMEAAGKAYQGETGNTVQFSFGSSGAMVAQIKSGGDTDVFISAANKQMDELDAGKMVDAGTRRVVVRNTLVVVVPPGRRVCRGILRNWRGRSIRRLRWGSRRRCRRGSMGWRC